MMKYAVIYHDIAKSDNFELIDIGNDLDRVCASMFNHFDDNNEQTKRCLMARGERGRNRQGITYFVVDLNDPPVFASDYQYLSCYHILYKEDIRRFADDKNI